MKNKTFKINAFISNIDNKYAEQEIQQMFSDWIDNNKLMGHWTINQIDKNEKGN